MQLFQQVWEEGSAPSEWKDALIVPIPKKGDLSLCDNWHGISLLDVGKLFKKTIQCRLQAVAEEVLLDWFWQGRGGVDMIFGARHLIEKAIEHQTKILMVFVDLRKYDSVPRRTVWCVLEKYGIPEPILKLVHSLHDDMKAEVTVDGPRDGQVAPEFEVCNGLQQGCLAPTLLACTSTCDQTVEREVC